MNSRDSRFEWLRVCAILFVVAHHVLMFGGDVCGYMSPFRVNGETVVGVVLNSLFVTGVNLFVMISGWFGIGRVWRPVVRLIVECAVFGALAMVLSLLLYSFLPLDKVEGCFSIDLLWRSVRFTNWWFVTHYLMLVLAAPLLEAALKNVGRRSLEHVLVCMLLFNCLFGFCWGYVNASGYNVVNFIMIYLLARYMRLFPMAVVNRLICQRAWAVIVVCMALATVWFLLDKSGWAAGRLSRAWSYNNPVIVLESVAVFSLFLKLRCDDKRAERFAPYVLGVYLLQSAPSLVYYRNVLGSWLFDNYGYVGFMVAVAVLAVVCFVLSVAVLVPLRRAMRLVRI